VGGWVGGWVDGWGDWEEEEGGGTGLSGGTAVQALQICMRSPLPDMLS